MPKLVHYTTENPPCHGSQTLPTFAALFWLEGENGRYISETKQKFKKLPANNRMHSSAALRTNYMWSNIIIVYVNVCVRISECVEGVCEGYIQVKVTNTRRSLKSIECATNTLQYSPLHSPSHALAACWHTIHCESKLLVLSL